MRVRALLLMGILVLACSAQQAAPLQPPPPLAVMSASICSVVLDPASFKDQRVAVRGQVLSVFGVWTIRDPECNRAIRLVIPNPDLLPAADADVFRRLERVVSATVQPRDPRQVCLRCARYNVTATLTGDVIQLAPREPGQSRPVTQGLELVVDSVTDVAARDLLGVFYDAARYEPAP
jgi:hypothetical protein